MSKFAVEVCAIGEVRNHPNADRLDIAKLRGCEYQFIVGRDQYKVGDLVVYFPLDAVIPDNVLQALGLTGKLAGKARNRVKTIKLRGEISQGIVGPTSLLVLAANCGEFAEITVGRDVTDALNVTKYEPEVHIPGCAGSPLPPLPPLVAHYDLENAEREPEIRELLRTAYVVITEKIEGCHLAISRDPDGKVHLCSRHHELLVREHFTERWYQGAENSGLFAKLELLQTEQFPSKTVTIRGELIGPGIQKNIYGVPDFQVLCFEIEVDGVPIDAADCWRLFAAYRIAPVPILHIGVLGDGNIRDRSDGRSILCLDRVVAREGIVIRPTVEMRHPKFGRVILKQRSPAYLAAEE